MPDWMFSNAAGLIYISLLFAVIILTVSAVIVDQYERLVVLSLGKFKGIRGPGLRFVVPTVQVARRVSVQQMVDDIPLQEILTRDNVLVRVNGVVYYQVEDCEKAVIETEDHCKATTEMAQAVLRASIGSADLDDIADTEGMGRKVTAALAIRTAEWGVRTVAVEVKEIKIDEQMVRSIARQAMAERDRRARIIDAQGELEAAKMTAEAADILGSSPHGMQLRWMGTLKTIAANPAATVVCPIPNIMDPESVAKGDIPAEFIAHANLANSHCARNGINRVLDTAEHLHQHAHGEGDDVDDVPYVNGVSDD